MCACGLPAQIRASTALQLASGQMGKFCHGRANVEGPAHLVSFAASALYTMHRHVIDAPRCQNCLLPRPCVGDCLVTAVQSGPKENCSEPIASFFNGISVGIGPGRGESSTTRWSNNTGYDSIDVSTRFLKMTPNVISLQCYHEDGGANAGVLLEIHFVHQDGSRSCCYRLTSIPFV